MTAPASPDPISAEIDRLLEQLRSAFCGVSLTDHARASQVSKLIAALATDATASPSVLATLQVWLADYEEFNRAALAQAEWSWGPAFDPRITCH